ncbi:MAG TPA: slipin family protein [Terriglobales bacterium]|nr:slipin family protein [Terriglobales bacterium]
MELLVVAILIVIIAGLSVKIFFSVFRRVTVYEFQRGLKYKNGRMVGVLEPGAYWISRLNSDVTLVDVRSRFVSIVGQELLSSDGITLKLSIAAQYEIIDPKLAVHSSENVHTAIYLLLQMVLRDIVTGAKADDILGQRNQISARLLEMGVPHAEKIGLKLLAADVKDITLPGEMKKVYAQVVKAQKEGQAALEKARGETAALRNLANAAKMIEENPSLLQLRMLQHLGDSSGNTVVFGASTGEVVPIQRNGRKKVEKPDEESGE